jgi:hypothetical protein
MTASELSRELSIDEELSMFESGISGFLDEHATPAAHGASPVPVL